MNGPQVVVRDLVLGLELAKSTKDRADYVELRAKAQSAVAEEAMIDKVKRCWLVIDPDIACRFDATIGLYAPGDV